jgi:hypothetical protein
MRIAVNARFLLQPSYEEYSYYTIQLLIKLSQSHPEHQFILITDKSNSSQFTVSANVTVVVSGPATFNPLLWKFWYNFQLPLLLKRHKADLLICGDGICSLPARIPQVLLLNEAVFIQPGTAKQALPIFYRKQGSKFIEKAAVVIVSSLAAQERVVSVYPVAADKISVVSPAIDDLYTVLSSEKKQAIKEAYTDGKEYFIYSGLLDQQESLISLLKAFSGFKKRQKSSMKLVLAGKTGKAYPSFSKKLSAYKYREDVLVMPDIAEEKEAELIAASYALISTSGSALSLLKGMRCGTALLVLSSIPVEGMTEEDIVYADPQVPENIAEKMMLLYKDENRRNRSAVKGEAVAAGCSWEQSAATCWQVLTKAVE